MTTYHPRLIGVLALLLIVAFALTSVAIAQDAPDTLPVTGSGHNTSYDYITELDSLRTEGVEASMQYLEYPEVYEYSSDLQTLNQYTLDEAHAAAGAQSADDYITRMDELRAMSEAYLPEE